VVIKTGSGSPPPTRSAAQRHDPRRRVHTIPGADYEQVFGERRRCKPDGYGAYVRNEVVYGFLLEYDRATESTRKYAAKFRAYYAYRDSGEATRDYSGFPTVLFVTTD
jgi:hypothetical protein